ncbi:MAG: response regulator [Ktedonobacterales bacterium]|nr:response regulator [Ktedonobacterales bacterium]
MSIHVLIADDDEGIRETMRFALVEDTDEIFIQEATNGEVALTLMRESAHPLIVFLDNRMPDDGQQVFEDVVQDANLLERHIYILFSASKQFRVPDPVMHNHLLVLNKPFELDELAKVMQAAKVRMLAKVQASAQE